MHFCYVDESGDTATLPSATAPVAPALVIAGIIIRADKIPPITRQFLSIKQSFFPGDRNTHVPFLDVVLREIKGSNIRADAAGTSRRRRTHAIGFLDHVVRVLVANEAKLIGRVWIKTVGTAHDSRALYTSSIQAMCGYFENFLSANQSEGLFIADSREKTQNAQVAHSIFTQMFKMKGNEYPHILEMPTFGHSENHVGLQLADLLASGLIFPMALRSYCHPTITSHLVRPGYQALNARFGPTLDRLQHLYPHPSGHGITLGGITVADHDQTLDRSFLFRDPHAAGPR